MTDKKRGLGRGLTALLGDLPGPKESITRAEGLPLLPIEFLRPGPFQPRRVMDPDALQELAESIRAQGIVQPIVARKAGVNSYEIIAGERRWRAAQIAGVLEVPVLVRDLPDQAAMAIGLIENLQREDLNPLETAEALQRLIDEFGMTHQRVADAIGKSRAAVTNLLRLNDLDATVKNLLLNRSIDMGHARAIAGLPKPQQAPLAERIVKQALNVRAAEDLVRKSLVSKDKDPTPAVDADTLRLERMLSQKLGVLVQIRADRSGKGRLLISFEDLDQLQEIIKQLSHDESIHD